MNDVFFAGQGFSKAFGLYLIFPVLLRRVSRTTFKNALFPAVFVLLTRLLHRFLRRQSVNVSTARFVAGMGGATGMLVVLDRSPLVTSTLIPAFLVVRAVRVLCPDAVIQSTWTSLLVMCGSTSRILSTWLSHPDELAPSYRRFVDLHGGKLRQTGVSLPVPGGGSATDVYATMRAWATLKTPFPEGMLACDVIHGDFGRRCWAHLLWFFLAGLRRAAPTYLTVHGAFALLRLVRKVRKENRRWQDAPQEFGTAMVQEAPRLAVRVARSSAFLSLYCASAWWSACMAYKHGYGHVSRGRLASHTWLAGLATLVEARSRQSELATYCAVYAVDSLLRQRVKHNGPLPAWLVWISLASSAGVLTWRSDRVGHFVDKTILGLD